MKKSIKMLSIIIVIVMFLAGCSAGKFRGLLDPKNPTTVTVWNYYNSDQLAAFEKLVEEFNASVGLDKGIVVVSVSQGNIDGLANALLDSVTGKAGAQDIPSLASVYAETAYILKQDDGIVSLNDYFSNSELNNYIQGFIEEGKIANNDELYIFPISKSTECFVTNATDWVGFEKATGISIDSIKTIEDLVTAAGKYYTWTDSLTPKVKNDGKALYGRDSVSNYIYLGAKQLGHELFTVKEDGTVNFDFDKTTVKTLWDNYYIPYINGYFDASASYRSEDIKTGQILAATVSTSGISYIPTAVTDKDDKSHDIDIKITKSLPFENAKSNVAVQQGAGYCILKTDAAQQYASAIFLKWFTNDERNLEFSTMSGYSPVTKNANTADSIQSAFSTDEKLSAKENNIQEALLVSSEIFSNDETYSSKPFGGAKDIREILNTVLEETAKKDRTEIEKSMANGKSKADAIKKYTSDEYFNKWYNSVKKAIEEKLV